ncbi:MAG: YkgJ family cysteine cluster protein [Phycisphaerales bacterium]
MSGPTGDEWYRAGLRFECTQCGNCCTGPPGYVSFTDEEAAAMAQALDVSLQDFLDKYTHEANGNRSLNERKTAAGFDCVLLSRDEVTGRGSCSVYHARPMQCRTWPFWRENLRSPSAWKAAKRAVPCPGMDRGPLVPVESIRIQRDATP